MKYGQNRTNKYYQAKGIKRPEHQTGAIGTVHDRSIGTAHRGARVRTGQKSGFARGYRLWERETKDALR